MALTLTRTRPGWMLLGVGCGALWIVSAAWRWQIFLRMQGIREPLRRLTVIYLMAQFFGLVLPGAVAGDTVRVLSLLPRHRQSKVAVLFSVMLDHLAGMASIMLTTAAIIALRQPWLRRSPWLAQAMDGLMWFWVMCALVLGGAAIVSGTRLVHTAPRWLPFRRQIMESGLAFGMLSRRWGLTLAGVAVSFLTTYAYFATFYFASRAVGGEVGWLDLFSLLPLVDALAALPLTISGLGVREKLFEVLLKEVADVPAQISVLTSLAGFACSAFWGLVGGAVFLLDRRQRPELSPGRIREYLRSSEPALAEPAGPLSAMSGQSARCTTTPATEPL